MLPIEHRKTRIGKVWKYTHLPFQCNFEVKKGETDPSPPAKTLIGHIKADQSIAPLTLYGCGDMMMDISFDFFLESNF